MNKKIKQVARKHRKKRAKHKTKIKELKAKQAPGTEAEVKGDAAGS